MAKKGKGKNLASVRTGSSTENENQTDKETALLSGQIIRMSSEKFRLSKSKIEDDEMLSGGSNILFAKGKKLKNKGKNQNQSRKVLVYFAIEGKWKEVSIENLG